ncbi:MAG: Eco57I restriction-modification methylase domain-containing protein, partial [Planctomycetaceae bacterium]|nr:Eco57I restriction-modification methylase domain-containing protein [Planctomycetaceae bacterium]
MSLTKTEFTSHLENFDFRTLFNKMGWNNDKTKHSIVVDDITFNLEAVAEKSGFKILVCSPLPNGSIPEYSQRIKIDQKITKFFQEHLLIFVDKKQTAQLWQLVVRQLLKPITVTPVEWHIKQDIDRLYQRFANVFFELDEEDNITIIDVKSRLRENFQVNNEKVTKKFYDRFKTEHDKFKSFIKGIKEIADLEWYASLMLNRLMFIYFIQKKRFLDGDIHYLKKRLKEVQALKGKDQFHQTFYRYFLLKLFHDGLGKRERNKELEKLIGKIPYLNGGFFEVHEIESRNDNIDIPDEAFEKLFQFFDEFEWHLDTRYHATGKEINPDVVGYIFEKYINQKEKGAYYTKEDITEYISKNTIIPFLFDKSGIDENHPVWQLLQDDPDCYIYNAVKKGVDILLPPEIEVGINDVSQRTDWNKPASSDYALPTETWREHVARRTRCLDIRNKIISGMVKTVIDLITLNLDIRQLTQDMIFSTDDPEWLWRFYSALDSVTILDPTCGSGAFLFAAMNILEPLYDACLIRMENMPGRLPAKYADVKRKIQSHPNRRYFICKNIILNNLYGVDIMDEAVEICKLRLFLKLAAEVETVDKIEPLPDIDFNIRSGNTLVGYVSLEQIRQSQKNKLTLDDDLQKIELSANNIDGLFRKFRENQTNDQTGFIPHLKQDLRNNLHKLRDQLDHYLANEYNIGLDDSEGFLNWQNSHQPFHWIVEFYGILHNGGFDVVIGNPPYVEYTKVKKEYQIKNYKTEKCGNLYGFIIERAIQISQTNLLGFIIPLAAFGTP